MLKPSSSELNHCRELALQPGSVFEFTSRFLPVDTLEPLLSVYALKQAICTIPDAPTDDSVKWEKLKWWGEELLADSTSPSRHPVLRAMHICGARSKLQDSFMLRLVTDALMQIEMAPFADEAAMLERFVVQGTSVAELELALDEADVAGQNGELLAAASSLFDLIMSFAPGQHSKIESLPLNLLARFNVSSDDLGETRDSEKLASVISELVTINLEWYSRGLSGLRISSAFETNMAPAAHLQLRWMMEKRRLQRISKNIPGFLKSGTRFGPADAWYAWRFLRKLV